MRFVFSEVPQPGIGSFIRESSCWKMEVILGDPNYPGVVVIVPITNEPRVPILESATHKRHIAFVARVFIQAIALLAAEDRVLRDSQHFKRWNA
jgi:hypothetical protein